MPDAALIRDAAPSDFGAIVALNLESEHFLSPMDRARLEHLDARAALHLVAESAGRVAAFLLAFREGADYDSVNYRWFDDRYARFLYIDRVAVAGQARGRGLAGALYHAVFDHAARHGVTKVTCEYDVEPPNEPSRAFHERLGFRELARQSVAGGRKQVSLQCAPVPAPERIGPATRTAR